MMEVSAGAQLYHDEHVQRANRGGDHNEEVAGRHHLGMDASEAQPTLLRIGRTRRSTGAQVFSDIARRYLNAELQLQFVSNSFLTQVTFPAAVSPSS